MKRNISILALFFISLYSYAQVTSDYSVVANAADGWTAPNSLAGVTYNTTGGNPTGFITATPTFNPGSIAGPTPRFFFFTAPPKFFGNFISYYGGALTYNLQQGTLTTVVVQAEAVISNGTITLFYFPTTPFNPAATPAWSSYVIILNELTGFWKTSNSNTGTAATQAEVKAVLGNLTSLLIRGRFNAILSPPATGLDNVVLQPLITVTSQPKPQAVCDGAIASLSSTASGNNNITYHWQIFSAATGGFSDLTASTIYSGVTTTTLSINTSGNKGAGSYRCRVSGNNTADVFSSTVTVTVNPIPLAPTTTGNSACGPSSIILNAFGGTNGQYRWYTVASGGTAIAGQVNSSYSTPSLSATTIFYVSIDNGTCESPRTPLIATINTIPPPPTATGNSACGSASLTLNTSGAANGQYRWYTVASGGTAIAGEVNNSYVTPLLTATTNYYVSINNGTCESTRTSVMATINTVPNPPVANGVVVCSGFSVTLNASGGTNGQYKWYTVPSLGSPVAGEVNSSYTTPVLTATTTYYVTITSDGCESNRTSVTATINTGCTPPVITTKPLATQLGGKITLDLIPLIKTTNSGLDLKSLQIITPPSSGGKASIDAAGVLTIDYNGLKFSGIENLSIKACDLNGNCAQQNFSIDVSETPSSNEIIVYNAVSPEGKNPILHIGSIEGLSSKVSIYNRWGDEVFSISDYDNKTRVFAGLTNDGSKLPSGTYFYKIVLSSTGKTITGFLSLKY
jgi:hypothetical protein